MASPSSTKSLPVYISTETFHSILTHQTLIKHLHTSLAADGTSSSLSAPLRHSHAVSAAASLLLMPSWSSSPSLPYIGVKLVTYFPLSSPDIHGSFVLFSSASGQTLASIDGTALTLFRTACVSALASRLLSRHDSEVLVMIGAGALAPHLIRAHIAARPSLKRVIIWNRTEDKARKLAAEIKLDDVEVEWSGSLDEAVARGDIVSCAKNSEVELVRGERLKIGAHLDLVGSFRHSMKECDDEAVRRGRVFVDNEAALEEAGELVGAIERGVIEKSDVCGMLAELERVFVMKMSAL